MTGAINITLTVRDGRVAAQIAPAASLPVAAMLIGRSPDAAADLLPRLFNLCAAAQRRAARLALDLPVGDVTALVQEIRREHLLKLFVIWPNLLGLPVSPPPQGETAVVRRALFGDAGMPAPDMFSAWLESEAGVAPLMRRIAAQFGPHEASADLPSIPAEATMTPGGYDNSPAARQATQPTVSAVATRHGKGPLWRAFGRLADLDACLNTAPASCVLADGTAVVGAARGLYGVRATARRGKVTSFHRVTPTDHLIAPGGVLAQSLASLPADKTNLAPLVLSLLDPCTPVRLHEVCHA